VFEDSLSLYGEAAQLVPDNVRVQYHLAVSCMANNDYRRAIACFDKVRPLNPLYQRADILLLTGICYQELGHLRQAKWYFAQAIICDPNRESITRFSGILAIEGNLDGAAWLLGVWNQATGDTELSPQPRGLQLHG
jgi:tetratricopeptide (TPR) repeat protein